jgi:anti-sigma-K factor RskA
VSDIHALSGAYAVDALDDDERVQFEQHLTRCPECRAEVQSFCETAALLADTQSETPPPSLRASVLTGIGAVRPLPPETPAVAAATTSGAGVVRTLRRRTLPILAAAAAILIALGVVIAHPWTGGSSSADLAEQIQKAPDVVKITEPVEGGGTLTIYRSKALKRAVMVGSDVPAPKAGTTYQLWLQQPGQGMVSAGLMPDTTEPTVLTGDAATAEAAAVSVEPETGSAKPTTTPIALFPLTAANGGNGSA